MCPACKLAFSAHLCAAAREHLVVVPHHVVANKLSVHLPSPPHHTQMLAGHGSTCATIHSKKPSHHNQGKTTLTYAKARSASYTPPLSLPSFARTKARSSTPQLLGVHYTFPTLQGRKHETPPSLCAGNQPISLHRCLPTRLPFRHFLPASHFASCDPYAVPHGRVQEKIIIRGIIR